MILKDEKRDLGTSTHTMWTFRISCDKCKGVVGVTLPTREQTQRFLYETGWRVNSKARKYFHLCKRCAK